MINYYTDTSEDSIDAEELELYNLIMSYRAQNGLPSIELSKALTAVAGRHALDTVYNVGKYVGHSWSDAPYSSSDSSTYRNMWDAPERIGTGYKSDGFEISTGFTGSNVQILDTSAPRALASWQGSTGHDNVILNKDIWAPFDWQAIGIGIHKGVAHVWFGAAKDATGEPVIDSVKAVSTVTGTFDNDVYAYSSSTTTYDLGSGVDTISINAFSSSVSVSSTAFGKTMNVNGQSVTLNSVERLAFNDGTMALDTGVGESAGMAFRIYQAAFARKPDDGGLKFWLKEVDSGSSLKQVANGFLSSAEFQAVYGAKPSNIDYVGKLYQNVLQRDGETSGIKFWVSQLETGARDTADVLAGFAESPENVALVGQTISEGFFLSA